MYVNDDDDVSLVPGDVAVCVTVHVPKEWGEPGEEDVTDDPNGPHVRHGGDILIVDNFWSQELWSSTHHPLLQV